FVREAVIGRDAAKAERGIGVAGSVPCRHLKALKGVRVALLEARMSGELSDLVRRFGGVPYSAQAVREVPRLEQVPALIDTLSEGRFSIVVFLTGAGVMALMREAERLG